MQNQRIGSVIINETKNVLITFLAAKSVIDGQMTLGVMFAVQYVVGQMNGPVDQLIGFFHSTQDAKISLERLAEVHDQPGEDAESDVKINEMPGNQGFTVTDITFQYEGPNSPKVIDHVNFRIPENKITAIVGPSGSGKSTLLKLLLGLYTPAHGDILIGDTPLGVINKRVYRHHCGAVLQDGYLFSDTLARNIALSDETIDTGRLAESARMANLTELIRSYPLGFNTRVGFEGRGLSQGQKQRLLIARAIYKDPSLIFFDEATNSLDANNEKVIMENMREFFTGRTVIIVAHRLSTVKNADQILVMDHGLIVETGNHEELVRKRGHYYNLVKNQLELGL